MYTSKKLFFWAQKKLSLITISPYNEALILLCYVTKQKKGELLSDLFSPSHSLEFDQTQHFQQIVCQRARGIPLAYLLKHKEFMGLDFYVDTRVLIPRPETETLVQESLKAINSLCKDFQEPLEVLELGIGQGIISISLLYYNAQRFQTIPLKLKACDISKDALDVTKRNQAQHCKIFPLYQSDLFKNLPPQHYHLIMANLPYVETKIIQNLYQPSFNGEKHQQALYFEPKIALNGESLDGLAILKRAIDGASSCLYPGGLLLLEAAPFQMRCLEQVLENYGFSHRIAKDLSGKERVILGYLEQKQ